MRKTVLFLFMAAGFPVVAQITVPETRKALYGIVEATWCGNCGQYGHPATSDIISQTSPNAIYVGLHRSTTSALYAPHANDLATAFGVAGQPVFTVNGLNYGGWSGSLVNSVVTAIDDFYSPSGAPVNAGFEYGVVGDTIYVHTLTTFFTDTTGEYYVGVYVYEDSIWEWQANYDPGIPDMDIWHNHILRVAIDGAFGVSIANGSITSGSSYHRNFKYKIDPSWNPGHLHVFTVTWKKNGSSFQFVNANDQGAVITGSVGMDDAERAGVSVFPNPFADRVYISGASAEGQVIRVLDLSGKEVVKVENTSCIDLPDLAPGTYILQVGIGNGWSVHRIVKH